ncbi:hypothetical protein FGG08_003977 [Glutinoglossum americanum]|uniref:Uncharacterized protein n=1 Tax=Glutinoglossum americanum TaxID=1670608 RepID=A0A9P8L025_9PEZI|nr:hypothetical protein FGG08_003977 [Glutinoglossum americanum]
MTFAPLPPVRACLFDVDGLLINSEDIYTEAYNNILHSCGKPSLSWSVKARQQSRGRQGTLRLITWCDVPISPEDWESRSRAQRELFRKTELLPGVPKLLSTLSRHTSPPVYMALASSSGRSLFDVKTSHLPDIARAFPSQCRAFGNDAEMAGKQKKPSPDLFLLALQRINDTLSPGDKRVRPEECLVFEDSIAGVEAGRRAGMRVVWVPHPGLLEVCSGREESVLAGTTEQDVGELGPMVPEGGQENLPERVKSRDAWAELITSLEDFPYEDYGIHPSS